MPTASLRLLPGRVARGYGLAASTWIVVSDGALALARGRLSWVQWAGIVKGLAFVTVTAVALHLVLGRLTRQIDAAHDRVASERERFEALVRRSSDIIAVVDPDGSLDFVSPSVTTHLGWRPADLADVSLLDYIHPDDRHLARSVALDLAADRDEEGEPQVLRFLTIDGTWCHLEVTAAVQAADAAVRGIVVNARDVTEQIRVQNALQRATVRDPLTGLRNRHEFEAGVRDIALAVRSPAARLVVMAMDIDRFREVNEDAGTRGGDEVLREMARRLDRLCPAGGVTGRLGADGLAAAFPLVDSHEAEADVRALSAQVRMALGRPITANDHSFSLSVAVGAAICVTDAAPLEALLAAEGVLAEAKGLPDRMALTVDPVSVPSRVRNAELHEAIANDELVMVYQPQVHLGTGQTVGLEALVRWDHPTRGLLTPGAFLDEAEAQGLQPAITRRVLSLATSFLASLDEAPAVRVSVNLSLDDLSRRELAGEVLEALERSGLDPWRLRLELTERALLIQPERSIETMHELRHHGVTFSVDDFGTGFSSFTHLRSLPVDEIKIDGSFVNDLRDKRSRAIVRSIIDLADEVGLDTIAEGIEETHTLAAVRELGCRHGQGYLLARPCMPQEVPGLTGRPSV